MRRVCAMDHSAFVEAVDDAPILYDAVMLSNAVYFLVGDASSVFADRLLKCDLTTGAVEQIANGSFSGLCVTGEGTLLAMLSFLDASSKLVAIDAEHGEQTEVAVRLPQMAAYPREDPQTGSIYFMTDRFVYRLDHAGGSAEVYEHSGRSLLPPCFSPLLGYCIPSMDLKQRPLRRRMSPFADRASRIGISRNTCANTTRAFKRPMRMRSPWKALRRTCCCKRITSTYTSLPFSQSC